MKIHWQGHRLQDDIGHEGTKIAAEWLIEEAASLIPDGVDRCRVGLYAATSDAAIDVSVNFWSAAIAEGVDFVNPRDFPWTLASAMAAHAASEVDIRGPCLTIVGGSEAGIAVLSHGIHDLLAGIVDLTLIAGIDPNGADVIPKKCTAAIIALTLKNTPLRTILEPISTDRAKVVGSPYASEPLSLFCEAIDNHREINITAPYECGYQLLFQR